VQKLAYSLTLLIGGVIILLFNMGVKPMKTMVIVAAFYAMVGGNVEKIDEKEIGAGLKVPNEQCQADKRRLESRADVLRTETRKDLEFPKLWVEYKVDCIGK
jgi:hypothetical protein